ncbi:LysR substrate-binding domain-containing protein [Nakamurella aerolata]|uniref:LysR substrate-binding domain-containing protein n=1 Tax=Nakamurella aerolata TaxID=1656892 RepID=UPI0031B627A9
MDVAFLGLAGSATPRTAHRELDRHALSLVVSEQHRLARRRRLRLAGLVDEPFVDFPVATPGRLQTDEAFRAAGLTRTVAFESSHLQVLLGLVRHGLGVAFLAPGVVSGQDSLVQLPVAGAPVRAEYVAWNGLNPTPAAGAFLRLLGGAGTG